MICMELVATSLVDKLVCLFLSVPFSFLSLDDDNKRPYINDLTFTMLFKIHYVT